MLMKILERSGAEAIGPDTRLVLQSTERSCDSCQTYAQKPPWFKFTLRNDKGFSHTVYADRFYVKGKPVLHVVDVSINFHSGKSFSDMDSATRWRALRMCWIEVHLGSSDFIANEAGKNFSGQRFQPVPTCFTLGPSLFESSLRPV